MFDGAEPEPHRTPGGDRHIVLVGPMGAGKTTVGSAVARRLGVPLVDSDAVILARTGRDAAGFARQHGVAALHTLEEEVVVAALAVTGRTVVAAAASVADSQRARQLIARHMCIFLTAGSSDLRARRGTSRHRRTIGTNEAEAVAHRVEVYAALAHLTVDTGHTGVEEAADLIIGLMGGGFHDDGDMSAPTGRGDL